MFLRKNSDTPSFIRSSRVKDIVESDPIQTVTLEAMMEREHSN
jgi:hypothetical protein